MHIYLYITSPKKTPQLRKSSAKSHSVSNALLSRVQKKNPRPITMSTESVEDQRLIAAVFKQIKLAKIILDYEQLAKDLEIKAMHPAKAASKRWIRYKQKHGLVAEKSAKNEVSDEMENCMNDTPKAGNGKKTGNAAESTNGGKKAESKKRKIVKDEDEDEEERGDSD
ncbi:hypothetical protein BOTNAR_0045g00320 [Botryotinia narcissicola]|uniref:Uncharacterized protein n=1 Tax=Botryotinia narcissicola TaxID=278944 RepID=A0A4Z1J0Z4_9HELO|nr:hypothetical protein BOTNAR_0045g00320 [Botryotinia narcissicola]